MIVKDILRKKGPEVFTISESKTIQDALKILINNNIGVLLVLNEDAKISGIISERDIIREVYNNPDGYLTKDVKDVMTKDIIFVEAKDDIEYVESIMTGNHIRHVPVLDNKVLVGLISIGDIVKSMLTEIKFQNKYLQDYIGGNY